MAAKHELFNDIRVKLDTVAVRSAIRVEHQAHMVPQTPGSKLTPFSRCLRVALRLKLVHCLKAHMK